MLLLLLLRKFVAAADLFAVMRVLNRQNGCHKEHESLASAATHFLWTCAKKTGEDTKGRASDFHPFFASECATRLWTKDHCQVTCLLSCCVSGNTTCENKSSTHNTPRQCNYADEFALRRCYHRFVKQAPILQTSHHGIVTSCRRVANRISVAERSHPPFRTFNGIIFCV